MNALSWEEITADRTLRDLPYKIETNRHNKILMSPSSAWKGNLEHEIGVLLREHLPQGKIVIEAPVKTAEGVSVADVGWISRDRWTPQRRAVSLDIAPEICVEILSPGNSREEILEKMTLYFAKGSDEVWLCDEEGRMEFFTATSAPNSVPASLFCPAFPRQIDVD